MRKLLLPLEKHLRVEADRHGGLLIVLAVEYLHTRKALDLRQRNESEENKQVKVTIAVDNAMMDTLDLTFSFCAQNLQKLTHYLLESDQQLTANNKDDLERRLTPGQLLSSCFVGLEVFCYNLDLYQDMYSSIDLINISEKMIKSHRYIEAQQVTMQVAFIAKHRLRWKEAEILLLGLLPRVDTHAKQEVLLNLVDSTPDSMAKLKYIVQLAKLQNPKFSKEAELLRPSSLFKHCRELIDIITYATDFSTFMGFCTYLNIVTYFVNEVACSIADSLLSIFTRIINFSSNKKLWKRIRNESADNHQLLNSCINSLFEGVRCCSLSFASSYIQQYVYFLLNWVHLEEVSLVRRPLSILLVSFLSKEIKGVKLRIRFDQWFAVAFYVEGSDLIKHFQLDLKLHSSKDCKEEMGLLEEHLTSNAILNLTAESMNQFIIELSQNFIQLMLCPYLNFLLLHHFLELTNVFCLSASYHNRDIKPGFTAALIPLYKPLKMLVGRLVDVALEPVEVFHRAWEIFVDFFTTIDEYLEETLLDVIMSMLNKHFCRGDILLPELPIIEAVCLTLPSFSSLSGQYADLVERVFIKVCELIPNSIHTDSIYGLLEKLIVFRPKVLESRELLITLLEQLTSAYTDEDDRWRQFVGDVGKRLLTFGTQQLKEAIDFLCEPPKVPHAGPLGKKILTSHQYQKIQQDSEIRKIYILSRWLKLSRELYVPCKIKEYLLELADQLVQRIHQSPDPKELNMQFHRFYCIAKHLALNEVELSSRFFSLFEMYHSPIVFGCLVLMAGNRKSVSLEQYDTYFRVAYEEIDSPWRNISDLSFYLIADFARVYNPHIAEVLMEMIETGDQYPSIIALSILHKFCLQYYGQSKALQYASPLHEILAVLCERLNELYNSYSCKYQEDLTYYVINRLRRHFSVLGDPYHEYMLAAEYDYKLAEALNITPRIESIVDREFSKYAEDYLKTEIYLPRKTEYKIKAPEDTEGFFEVTEYSLPTIKPPIDTQSPPLANEEAKPVITNAITRVPVRYIQINVTTPKTPPVTSAVVNNGKKSSQPDQTKLFTTPRANQQPTKEKYSSNKRTPKHSNSTTIFSAKHGSPVVEVESKNEKFRINLGHLNYRWRYGLEMIHKKAKPTTKRRNT